MAEAWRTKRLPGIEFLRRFLQHVLPRGFHKVRYYGLWVSNDLVLAAWQGGSSGSNPAAAYRRYVEQGLARPPKNPLAGAAH